MIVVRNVFRLKFGATKEAVSAFKDAQVLAQKLRPGGVPPRILTDLVSSFYTLVLELTFDSLADFEKSTQAMMANQDWKNWYQQVLPLIDSGHREIFTIVA
jgi:hypothetical protein